MNPTISYDDVLVRTQDTPNPTALKFIVNHAIKSDGKATFTSLEQSQNFILPRSLFEIEGVKQVYFYQNTITITFTEFTDLSEVEPQVTAVIKTRLPVHDPNFVAPDEEVKARTKVDRSHMSPERQAVEEILDRTIRPGLQSDGGDVEVTSFENNVVKILYQGACGGCPSSMMGTLDAIQNILRHEMNNENIVVEPI